VSELTYITSARCGWCRKADPIIEQLQKDGVEIRVLDVTIPEQQEEARVIKRKHNANCGTPFFIDAESGNSVCGFKEEGIRAWAKGEKYTSKPKSNTGISLPKDAKISIVDNEEKFWMQIARLRYSSKVQKGFIKRHWKGPPLPELQNAYMKKFGDNFIVAAHNDTLLGYARCIDGDIGICVVPELQSRGIASMLLEELLKRYPDAHARVKKDNESSKKLFEKFGFRVVDEIDVDCLHGIIFEKVLVMNRETQPV
tara:strand:+ start:944 stop:1708 length:765 start_codon:yes stop_codon:yes gene_type:complete